MAGRREEVRKAGFRVDSSMFFFCTAKKKSGGGAGGGVKAKDKMFFGEKEVKNVGGKGNARKGGEWQWVSKTETLPAPPPPQQS